MIEVSENNSKVIRLPALRVKQSESRYLYSFAVDGKKLQEFTTISRIGRDDAEQIAGYQRPEVIAHIAEIQSYLESENPMIPNALVIAFDDTVTFEHAPSPADTDYSQSGILVIPLRDGKDCDKPGWIVDGQQRSAAIRNAQVSAFPMCVVGFVAETDAEQREQFILVNSTKPLPKGLIYELLPSTNAQLPSLLQKRRFPAMVLEQLNRNPDSPFHRLIRTPTNGDGVIADNSILKMVENSLSDGVLYHYREFELVNSDIEGMVGVLNKYWYAVKDVFSDAWGKSPTKSRLMHGAGIVCMGFLMDTICSQFDDPGNISSSDFKEHLLPLQDACKWTKGTWEFDVELKRRWNEIQNLPKDIYILTDHLHALYRQLVMNKKDGVDGSDEN